MQGFKTWTSNNRSTKSKVQRCHAHFLYVFAHKEATTKMHTHYPVVVLALKWRRKGGNKKTQTGKPTKLWHHHKVELHFHKQHRKSPWTSKGRSWKICRLFQPQVLVLAYVNFCIEIILRNSKAWCGNWECRKTTVPSDHKVYKYQQFLQKFFLFFLMFQIWNIFFLINYRIFNNLLKWSPKETFQIYF